jgi:UDP-2,4-diacetamido-2,4,6-trideoxy-beta-L-altropyranose hydrolase
MNLYIRADADPIIGIGHVMRCIALAQAWQDQGGEVTFISRCESEPLLRRISDEGFNCIPVENLHPHPSDLNGVVDFLSKIPVSHFAFQNWFVLDGYHFTSECQKAIHETGVNLLVMDDMRHLACYHADIILNQNSGAGDLIYNCSESAIVLAGTDYVFLRREFLKYRNFSPTIPECARKILVSLGGADPDNVTLKVIRALCLIGESQIEVTVVVGPANIHGEHIRSVLESTGMKCNLLMNPPNMVELMADADLAISGGGGTYWELAYMGVPCVMIILAENQKQVAEVLERDGTVDNLGWHHLLSADIIADRIDNLIKSKQARSDMSHKGQVLIDGKGADRVVEVMKTHTREGNKAW